MRGFWTEEAHALLVEAAGRDLSAREIAAELGITRNAVIGRCHREGVALREIPRTPQGPTSRKYKGGKDDGFRVAVVCAIFTGESNAKCSRRLSISLGSINRWRRDPEIAAQAKALASRVNALHAARQADREAAEETSAQQECERLGRVNAAVLARMPERHRKMMERRIDGETLEQVGAVWGLSRERIRQIEVRWRLEGLEVRQTRPLNRDAAERLMGRMHVRGFDKAKVAEFKIGGDLTPYWKAKVAKALAEFPPSP